MKTDNWIVTPIGIAKFPHLVKPDNFKGDERFKTNLLLTPEDATALRKKLEAFVEENRRTITTKKPKLGSLRKEEDKEGNETGLYEILAKSRYKPVIKDSKNQKITDEIKIGGGSKVRLMVEPIAYDGGVSLRLHGVQVVELVEFGGGNGPDFDEIDDGYVAEVGVDSSEDSSEHEDAPDI